MTKERMAIYLYIMGMVAWEPKIQIEFEVKTNTEKRKDFWWNFGRELDRRLERNGTILTNYFNYGNMKSFTVYAGAWTSRDDIQWLKDFLKKKKVEFKFTEWR